jgi:hypothetical protein
LPYEKVKLKFKTYNTMSKGNMTTTGGSAAQGSAQATPQTTQSATTKKISWSDKIRNVLSSDEGNLEK